MQFVIVSFFSANMSQRVVVNYGAEENAKRFRAGVVTAERIAEKFGLSEDTIIVDILNNGYLTVPRLDNSFDLSVSFGPYTMVTR